MRFDLDSEITVDLAYAKINLSQGAERARNSLLHPSARMDKLAAYHEALRFGDANGSIAPGHWILAEQAAHIAAGINISIETAARTIILEHLKWQKKAAEIARIVRSTELLLEAAATPREVHDIITKVQWPTTERVLS